MAFGLKYHCIAFFIKYNLAFVLKYHHISGGDLAGHSSPKTVITYPDKTPPYLPTNKSPERHGGDGGYRDPGMRASVVEGGGGDERQIHFVKVNSYVAREPNITVNPNQNSEAWTPLLNQLHQESTL